MEKPRQKSTFQEKRTKSHIQKTKMNYRDPVFAVFCRAPFNAVERDKMLQDIKDAFASGKCSARSSECFWLYYRQGLTVDEIGKLLEVNKSTVSRHIKRAISACRIALGLVEFRTTPLGRPYLTK